MPRAHPSYSVPIALFLALSAAAPSVSAAEPVDPTKAPLAPRVGREIGKFVGGPEHASIKGVAFTPDGKQVVTGSSYLTGGSDKFWVRDCTVRVWDVATSKELRRFEDLPSPIWNISLSPNGDRVAAGSGDSLQRGKPFDCVIRLWDMRTGKELRQFVGHGQPVWSTAFSSDGLQLLSGSGEFAKPEPIDCSVRLWDAATGKELRRMDGHNGRVYGVAFLPGDRLAVSASGDRTAKVWDLKTGRDVHTLKGHTNAVHAVAVSPLGRVVATAGWDHTVRLWDVDKGEELLSIKAGESLILSVAFSPDGKMVASGGYDGTIRLWDARTGRALGVLQGNGGLASVVTFAPDGKSLLAGLSDHSTKLWDISK